MGAALRSGRWLALVLLVVASVLPLPASSASPDARAQLHDRLEKLRDDTHSMSWVEDSWERKGDKTETSESRALWLSNGQLRLDLLAGRGQGAVVSVNGEDVTVRLPKALRAFKKHYKVTDPEVQSLRGHPANEAGFLDTLGYALDHWSDVSTEFEGDQAVLSFVNSDGLKEKLFVQLNPLMPLRTEVSEQDQVVERNTFQQVVLNPQLSPDALKA